MSKRFFSVLFCAMLLLSIAVPSYAETEEVKETPVIRVLDIFTAEEFLEFAENCRLDSFSQNLEVSLEENIDLSGHDFAGVPIFSGTFRGNGNIISGVSITSDGSYQGLFRYLTQEASVLDLTVHGEIQPVGSRSVVGGIAGSNAGSIIHCKFSGTVSGSDYVAGIAGKNTVTGIIAYANAEGEIFGDHFVGGIAGENNGVIRSCTNWAQINTTPKQNTVNFSDITLDTLTNSEAANTVTDIGGVAGLSSGVIRDCDNHGDVGYQLMGYNIGGITGTQSGYITQSKNYGSIQGRKETGGIVGQMEPVTQIEFTEDTLQILRGQLNTMSGLVNRASGNAQSNASQIAGQIGLLQDQVETAKDAVEALFPSEGAPGLPDGDAIVAARNTLSKTMESMPGTMRSIASAAQSTVSGLSRDLSAVSGQINAMGQTLNNGAENLGGTITDISDQDTPELLTGKVENCENLGSVLADLNVGGIAGAMAMENDLDILEDWEQYGEESLNFSSEIRAVILNCENSGAVTGKKQNAGGLVGWQSQGLLKGSTNTGKVDAAGANHTGGVCGSSTGFIRACFAKCEVSGDSYVGGIAGSAAIVTDSLAQVKLTTAREKQGAIIGWREETLTDADDPISGNHYLVVGDDPGAIDGISYAGLAEPKALDTFLQIEELPAVFRTVTIRFIFENGRMEELLIPSGGELKASQIPVLPKKQGYSARWEGLDQAELSDILFDTSFEAVYAGYRTTIESDEVWKDGRPILLLEGSFTDDAVVSVSASDTVPVMTQKESLLNAWTIQSNESGARARLILDDSVNAENLKLLICNADGQWIEQEFHLDGSYLLFTMEQSDANIALVQVQADHTLWIAGGASIAGIVLLVVVMIVRKKRRMNRVESTEGV